MTHATDRPDRPDPLDDDLGWMLGIVFRGYVRAAEHVLTDIPGGPRGYHLLTAAISGPARNQGALAEELGIDRTVLTYLIDDLERPGFVARRATRPTGATGWSTSPTTAAPPGSSGARRCGRSSRICWGRSPRPSRRRCGHCCNGSPARPRRRIRCVTSARW
ncbi:MarR family winged helix-turn-helix transcriptional regulator [Micromonospora tarensis]|uniref:MarR family winged helix-turn-helix transcriptional regulator n=1 Tax=Micromonospora tarensis TaxID=2806100 RepID=UPI001EE4C4D8|nr:MarR family winged helix-turn-helix transcriptional regulator [Micromonospora tarensis]